MKRLQRIKKQIDSGKIPSELLDLIAEYGITKQIAGEEWSVLELSAELGKSTSTVKKIMDDKCAKGEWSSHRAILLNGHPGKVYRKVKK